MADDFERRNFSRDAPEHELLENFLDWQRATLLQKIDGLSDEELRRQMVPSGVSLLGIVKHLGWVEKGWFQRGIAGETYEAIWSESDPDADFRIEPDETTGEIVDFYKAQVRRSREISRGASLDDGFTHGDMRFSVRWVLIHMIEETARHNGHVDIMREQIDGSTGS